MERKILHVDMDAFYASVEQRDNPELRGKPVIVGGRTGRGVVCTCSYEARSFGVHSAMPLFEARRLCPQGVFLPGNMHRYTEVSLEIMKIFQRYSPLVEQLSVDEAFLDLSGMERIGGAEKIARQVVAAIKEELGLTASAGLAPNKFLAKLASDMKKPAGFVIIKEKGVAEFLAPMAVNKIFGVGRSAENKLKKMGIMTMGQLAATDENVLRQVFGKNASMVRNLAQGIDYRPVIDDAAAKSVGKEITFAEDLTQLEDCRQAVLDLSGQTGWRLRNEGMVGRTVTLKVKYADFKTISRSCSSDVPVSWDEEIFEIADRMLSQVNLKDGVRLLGVTVSNLMPEGMDDGLGFFEDLRMKNRNNTVDELKNRFGEGIIARGVVKHHKPLNIKRD